eukprot:5187238-Prymnesium_polylepis.2
MVSSKSGLPPDSWFIPDSATHVPATAAKRQRTVYPMGGVVAALPNGGVRNVARQAAYRIVIRSKPRDSLRCGS